jgi:hypothetical protein
MSNIINFGEAKIKQSPHIFGTAYCVACKHTWEIVAQAGIKGFECPACHLDKGVLRYLVRPEEGSKVYECGCDNDLFLVQPHRILCISCGKGTSFAALAELTGGEA